MRPTNYVSAAIRIVIALAALGVGVAAIVAGGGAALVTFTLQSNLMMAISFAWTAFTLLGGLRTPPEWLEGSTVFYVVITGIVYNFVLNPGSFRSQHSVFLWLSGSDWAHVILPIAAFLVWLVFAEHRRIPWRYHWAWLIYLVAYLVIVVTLVAVIPSLSAPYPFIDVETYGVAGVAWRLAIYIIAFATLSAAMIGLDRWLPKRTFLSEFDPKDPANRAG